MLLALLLATLLLPGCSDSTVSGPPSRVVPDQYPTIQAAIDAAQPGEIVLVQPGVYSHLERRDIDPDRYPGGILATAFMKEGIGLVGNGDASAVVLRDTVAADSSVGIVFSQLSAVPFVQNVTVESYGTGLLVSRGEATAQFLRVVDCRVGLHLREPLDPIVTNSRLEGDSLGVLVEAGGGYLAAIIVHDCTVGGHLTTGALSWLEANLFCGNGTGLILDGGATPTLTLNSITDNTGSGLETGGGALPDLIATPRGVNITYPTGNDLYGNGKNFVVTGYNPPLSQPLDAVGQWWNTLDTLVVAEGVVNGPGATVDYVPIAPMSFFDLVFPDTRDQVCGQSPAAAPFLRPYALP